MNYSEARLKNLKEGDYFGHFKLGTGKRGPKHVHLEILRPTPFVKKI